METEADGEANCCHRASLLPAPPTSVSVGSGISTSWEVGQVLWAFREGEDVPLSDFRVPLGHSWTPVPRMKTIKAVRSMQCAHLPAASGGSSHSQGPPLTAFLSPSSWHKPVALVSDSCRGLVGVPVVAQQLANPTSIHEDKCLMPGLAQWVKNPSLP